MQRRHFVAGLGASAFSLTGGYVTIGRAEQSSTADGQATDESNSTTSESTDTATPSMDAPFPPNRDKVDETIWYRQVSNPDQSLVLEPSAETASLRRGTSAGPRLTTSRRRHSYSLATSP